jgi:hypothetical protein
VAVCAEREEAMRDKVRDDDLPEIRHRSGAEETGGSGRTGGEVDMVGIAMGILYLILKETRSCRWACHDGAMKLHIEGIVNECCRSATLLTSQ